MKLDKKYETGEHVTEINKLSKVASCCLYSANILAMYGRMNVKLKRNKPCLWRLGENKQNDSTQFRRQTARAIKS